jgi:alpha-glucosidase
MTAQGTAGRAGTKTRAESDAWWRTAVVYEIYLRSFHDGNGDGIGDVRGIRRRLPYLRRLGVDAMWITPWYPSPMIDGGYDVADYRTVAREHGGLDEARALLHDAHAAGIRVIIDLVANHTSDQHAWFRAAVAAAPGSPERRRYWLRAGRGRDGAVPPNNWESVFGGPAWTRLPPRPDEPEPQWYLHLFSRAQPDLNWSNTDVRREFKSILRFWFNLGVDGMRVDVAHGLSKDPRLPDLPAPGAPRASQEAEGASVEDHPHWDRDDVHELFRSWRRIADGYATSAGGPPAFVAEAWRIRRGGLARHVRPDGLHTAFNFDFLRCPWDAEAFRRVIDDHVDQLVDVGAAPTWVLSSHDLPRVVDRYAPDGALHRGDDPITIGRRRARAAALLMLALPGSAYIYQGDELGLPEATGLADGSRYDPMGQGPLVASSGRDGRRVPLPWTDDGPALGFSTRTPWLPQLAVWADLSVQRQEQDPSSTLSLYRTAIALRRKHLNGRPPRLTWRSSPRRSVLAFDRGDDFACVVNLGTDPVALPDDRAVLVASAGITDGLLAGDCAAWLGPATRRVTGSEGHRAGRRTAWDTPSGRRVMTVAEVERGRAKSGPGRSAATLNDVARAADVSRATASRALAGYGRISDATRQHVIETAERLGYRTNALARAVREGAGRPWSASSPRTSPTRSSPPRRTPLWPPPPARASTRSSRRPRRIRHESGTWSSNCSASVWTDSSSSRRVEPTARTCSRRRRSFSSTAASRGPNWTG